MSFIGSRSLSKAAFIYLLSAIEQSILWVNALVQPVALQQAAAQEGYITMNKRSIVEMTRQGPVNLFF
jgi:hypothetical protein